MNLNKEIKYKDTSDPNHKKEIIIPNRLAIEDDFLYIKNSYIKNSRISSHTLVNLVGANKYKTAGETLLSIFGIMKSDPIDPYQQYKGGLAEVAAHQYLMKEYPNTEFVTYKTSDFEKGNQFGDQEPFSGVLDIGIKNPSTIRMDLTFIPPLVMPVEVKSKEMMNDKGKLTKAYIDIVQKGIYPKDHILQGSNEALLAKSERYMMLYVFLKPEVSQLLDYIKKNDLWIWDKDYDAAYDFLGLSIDHFEFKYDIFKPDFRIIEAYRKRAYNYWNEVNQHQRIPLELFSKEQIIELKLFISNQSEVSDNANS